MVFLHDLDGLDRRAAGGQHRVEDHSGFAADVRGQLDVVAGSNCRFLVTLQADIADGHVGQELEHRPHETKASPKDGDGDDPVADCIAVYFFEGRLYAIGPGPQVAGRLVQQERDDLVRSLAELVWCRLTVAQPGQVVRHQWVLDDVERHFAPSSGGSTARPGSAMRPSASSFLTRAMFEADQLLFGL